MYLDGGGIYEVYILYINHKHFFSYSIELFWILDFKWEEGNIPNLKFIYNKLKNEYIQDKKNTKVGLELEII